MVLSTATLPEFNNVLALRLKGALDRMPLLQLRKLSVAVADAAVTLRGELHTAFEKEVALACVRRIAPDRALVDATVMSATPDLAAGTPQQPRLAWLERRISAPRPHHRPEPSVSAGSTRQKAFAY
jgi:hypothetical protein